MKVTFKESATAVEYHSKTALIEEAAADLLQKKVKNLTEHDLLTGRLFLFQSKEERRSARAKKLSAEEHHLQEFERHITRLTLIPKITQQFNKGVLDIHSLRTQEYVDLDRTPIIERNTRLNTRVSWREESKPMPKSVKRAAPSPSEEVVAEALCALAENPLKTQRSED